MPIFNHFDIIAPVYDRFIKQVNISRFATLIGLPVEGTLLDIGGGTGRKSYPLLEFVHGIVIADSSVGMLTQASMKKGLITVRCESENLPFLPESFERVIMVDAFHHVRDHRKTASELWRVIKAGGRIVLEEPDISRLPVKIMALIEKLLIMRSHLKSPQHIADFFNFPYAEINVEFENVTAWIVITKKTI